MAVPSPTPALTAPVGYTTDFNAPNDTWKWNVLCQTACLTIPGIMVVLRVYVRSWIKRVWILEDYLCCFSFLGLAVYSGLSTTVVVMGGGIHEWDITKETLESILYYDNITLISYGPAIACTKSAILLLYLRVFSPRRWSTLDVTVRALILIICGFYIALSVAKICQCIPRARIWDNTVPGQCVNLPVLLDTSGLFNIISDVLILLVPLKGVWSLQMARKRKMGIYLIFTVGIIAPVFSIIGLVKRFQLAGSPDQSYNQPLILLWAEAELATGMMIICLPTLPGVLHRHSKRPSKSVVNGSARSRSLKFFPHHGQSSTNRDDMLEDRDYFELTEGRIADSSVMMPKRAFINEITGGHGNTHADYDLGESEAIGTPVGGILKMTTIEQFDA